MLLNVVRLADLEVGDTAGLETCATKSGGHCLEKSSRLVTILTDSSTRSKAFVQSALILLELKSRAGVSEPAVAVQRTPAPANSADGAAVCHRFSAFSSASSTGRILTPSERSFEASRMQLERGVFAWLR